MAAYYPADWEGTMKPALRAWVVAALTTLGAPWTAGGGPRVIWAGQQGPGQTEDGPAPSKPFATIMALSLPDEVVPTEELGLDVSPTQMDIRIVTGGSFTLEVQLFADTRSAVELAAHALRHSLEQALPYREDLWEAGLVPGPAALRDATLFRGRREHRIVLETLVQLEMRTDVQDQPWIETVQPTVLGVT